MIKVQGFLYQFGLRGKLAPGNYEGQDYIDSNISRPPTTEKGLISYLDAPAKIKVAGPVTTSVNYQPVF